MAWKPTALAGSWADWTVIDAGTLSRVQFSGPGMCVGKPAGASTDELTPIAAYMAGEFNINSAGSDAKAMRQLNSVSLDQCIAEYRQLPFWQQLLGLGVNPQECSDIYMNSQVAALLTWGWNVRQDGPWDHKPKIAKRFNPRNPGGPQHWHRYGAKLYFYDVWSNRHYGYVGTACGFSADTLLDGAGVEQIGTNWSRGKGASSTPGVQGMRAYDNPEDRYAITQGVQLHRPKPSGITATDLVKLVVRMGPQITTKPYAP